jgi:hypothetical protein
MALWQMHRDTTSGASLLSASMAASPPWLSVTGSLVVISGIAFFRINGGSAARSSCTGLPMALWQMHRDQAQWHRSFPHQWRLRNLVDRY